MSIMSYDAYDLIERWQLRSGLKRLYREKYRNVLRNATEDNIEIVAQRYEQDSAPMRARLMEMESVELAARASGFGIVIADLAPLRFGNPLWREETGHRYFSAEGKQAVERAIAMARRDRFQRVIGYAMPITGLIGAVTGLVAVLATLK